DDVAFFHAGFFSGALLGHITNERALIFFQLELFCQGGIDVLNHYAEITASDTAIANEACCHITGEVRRNGKADSLITAATAEDGSIDADETALRIDERTTRVTGIDGCVGLDEILVVEAHSAATARGTNDPSGHGLANAERIADRQHNITDF